VVADAKELARQRIFRDGRKLTIEIGSYTTLGILLDAFLSAARECSTSHAPTYRNARLLELMGGSAPQPGWTLYESYMRTIDYISGMTDTYAASLARQFSGYYPPTQG
jgi:dGTPase